MQSTISSPHKHSLDQNLIEELAKKGSFTAQALLAPFFLSGINNTIEKKALENIEKEKAQLNHLESVSESKQFGFNESVKFWETLVDLKPKMSFADEQLSEIEKLAKEENAYALFVKLILTINTQPIQAFVYLQKAVRAGNAVAQYILAFLIAKVDPENRVNFTEFEKDILSMNKIITQFLSSKNVYSYIQERYCNIETLKQTSRILNEYKINLIATDNTMSFGKALIAAKTPLTTESKEIDLGKNKVSSFSDISAISVKYNEALKRLVMKKDFSLEDIYQFIMLQSEYKALPEINKNNDLGIIFAWINQHTLTHSEAVHIVLGCSILAKHNITSSDPKIAKIIQVFDVTDMLNSISFPLERELHLIKSSLDQFPSPAFGADRKKMMDFCTSTLSHPALDSSPDETPTRIENNLAHLTQGSVITRKKPSKELKPSRPPQQYNEHPIKEGKLFKKLKKEEVKPIAKSIVDEKRIKTDVDSLRELETRLLDEEKKRVDMFNAESTILTIKLRLYDQGMSHYLHEMTTMEYYEMAKKLVEAVRLLINSYSENTKEALNIALMLCESSNQHASNEMSFENDPTVNYSIQEFRDHALALLKAEIVFLLIKNDKKVEELTEKQLKNRMILIARALRYTHESDDDKEFPRQLKSTWAECEERLKRDFSPSNSTASVESSNAHGFFSNSSSSQSSTQPACVGSSRVP